MRAATPDVVIHRPNGHTSIRVAVKATCPGCHGSLGDATEAEILLTMAGVDVAAAYAAECGCYQ